MADNSARVFVIDDDGSVRRSLTYLLQSLGYTVETFESAEQFLARKPFHGIGCILLDVRMPGLSGLDLQERLNQMQRPMPIIFITGHGDLPMGVRAMKKGAVDFLVKPFDEGQLAAALKEALGKAVKELADFSNLHHFRKRLKTLSPREYDVFRLVINGRPNKLIAAALNIAEQTVKIHRGRVMQKLKVDSLAELVRLAEKAGLSPPEVRKKPH